MTLALAGALSKAGAPTSGVAQVETAVIVGTITGSGNATFTITSALVTGSPLAVSVAVLVDDTPTVVATKKSAANDATLNIAYTNGSSDS